MALPQSILFSQFCFFISRPSRKHGFSTWKLLQCRGRSVWEGTLGTPRIFLPSKSFQQKVEKETKERVWPRGRKPSQAVLFLRKVAFEFQDRLGTMSQARLEQAQTAQGRGGWDGSGAEPSGSDPEPAHA